MLSISDGIIVALIAGIVSVATTFLTNWLQRRNDKSKIIAEQTLPTKYDSLRSLHTSLVNCYNSFLPLRNDYIATSEEKNQMVEHSDALRRATIMSTIYLDVTSQAALWSLLILFHQALIKRALVLEKEQVARFMEMKAYATELRAHLEDVVRATREVDAELKAEYKDWVASHDNGGPQAGHEEEPPPKGISQELDAETRRVEAFLREDKGQNLDDDISIDNAEDQERLVKDFSWDKLEEGYNRALYSLRILLNP